MQIYPTCESINDSHSLIKCSKFKFRKMWLINFHCLHLNVRWNKRKVGIYHQVTGLNYIITKQQATNYRCRILRNSSLPKMSSKPRTPTPNGLVRGTQLLLHWKPRKWEE